MLSGVDRVSHPQKLGDRLGTPDACEVSYVTFFEGWVEDVVRFHASLVAHAAASWELVVVDNPGDDAASQTIATLDRVVHIPLRDPVGYGAARNLGLRQAGGRIVCVVDTSVELTGDPSPAITSALEDASVGVVGPWGVVTSDGFAFEEAGDGEVDAVEGYFMAMRRADLERTGLFDPKFKWYRNADIDMSFRIRDAGLRSVADLSLPVVRHEHRRWESTDPHDRDHMSHDNFHRFRRHWGDRPDLFTRLGG